MGIWIEIMMKERLKNSGNGLQMKQNCFYFNFPPAGAFPLTPLERASFGRSNTAVLVQPPKLKTSSYATGTNSSISDFSTIWV